jgi:uncharacterized protein YaiI (UPF0178 family)
MLIWIDADACPNMIKEIVFRAAERLKIETVLVANQPLRVPPSTVVRAVQVPPGFDGADKHIVASMSTGDLVITADIPLAAQVIEKGGLALNPRGEIYTKENVRERLSVRNFMDELRGGGVNTGGPAALGARDKQAFANGLDATLAKLRR